MNESLSKELIKMSRILMNVLDEYGCSKTFKSKVIEKVIHLIAEVDISNEDKILYFIAENLSEDKDIHKLSVSEDFIIRDNQTILKYKILSLLRDSYRRRDEISDEFSEKLDNLHQSSVINRSTHGSKIYEMHSSISKSEVERLEKSGKGICLPKMTMGFTDEVLFSIEVIYDLKKLMPNIFDNDEDDEED